MAENLTPKPDNVVAQDLGVSEAHGPDPSRPGPDMPRPTAKRLSLPSQRVHVCNAETENGKAQTHIVYDRHLVGHEIAPGQTIELDMLVEDIDYFVERRKPRAVNTINGGKIISVIKRCPIEIRDELGKPLAERADSKASAEAAESAHRVSQAVKPPPAQQRESRK